MYKYPIIIFEGIEASGKSTNIRVIANYLKKIKRKFIKIREPGGTKQSEVIRNLILNKKTNFNFKSDFFLIMASRSENVEKIINKNFNKKIILIDRFTDSTIAYQHYGMGYNLNLIKNLNKFILGKYKPNLTFLSTVNKKNLKKRLQKRVFKNKYDKFNFKFYSKVQNGYLKLAKNKNNYIILNSNIRNIKENSSFIINKVNKVI